MSRIRVLTACTLLAAFTTVVAAADPVITAAADLSKATRVSREAEQKLLQHLHRKINAVWEDTPLEDVLNEIATGASLPIWIDKQSLLDEGINLDSQVTLNLGELTIWQALHFVLPPFALAWQAPDGVLEIMSFTKAEEKMLTRVYDVSAIVKVLEPQLQSEFGLLSGFHKNLSGGGMGGGFFNVPEERRLSLLSSHNDNNFPTADFLLPQFGGMGGMGGGGGVAQGQRIGHSGPRAELALKMMLQKSFTANWADWDGDGGAIVTLPGQLVVRHTYRTHMAIQSLLNAVEGYLLRGTKAKGLLVQRPAYPQDEDAKILQKFSEPVSIDVVDETLENAMQSLTMSIGVRLWIDKQALQDEGINSDTQVSLKHDGIALHIVLNHLLHPLALTAVIEEGTLKVTTQTKADEHSLTQVYNTADLPGLTPQRLVAAIQQCTSLKWEDTDGDGGFLFMLTPTLSVIRQPQQGHFEISALLEEIRKTADPKQETATPKHEQRIYTLEDQTAISNLVTALPQLIPTWDTKQGSIHRLGESLLISQPPLVHYQVGEIIGALNASHRRLHPLPPPVKQPAPTQPTAPPTTAPSQPASPTPPTQSPSTSGGPEKTEPPKTRSGAE